MANDGKDQYIGLPMAWRVQRQNGFKFFSESYDPLNMNGMYLDCFEVSEFFNHLTDTELTIDSVANELMYMLRDSERTLIDFIVDGYKEANTIPVNCCGNCQDNPADPSVETSLCPHKEHSNRCSNSVCKMHCAIEETINLDKE